MCRNLSDATMSASGVAKKSPRRSEIDERPHLVERARKVVTQEDCFIYAPEFESLSTERVEADVANARLFIPPTEKPPVGTPPYLAHLYSTSLLTAEGERLLFRKMNFLRYRCNVLRSTVDLDSPNETTLAVIESLAADALETRSQIIECNLRLVVSIARKLRHRLTQFDELVGEGNLVLLNATDKFDYSRGYRFSTYATLSVQRHIYRLQEKARLGRRQEPNVNNDFLEELERRTESDQELIRDLQRLDVLMSAAPQILDDREQLVVSERFGLDVPGNGKPLRELAANLGVSKERIRQIQISATDKLFDFAFESGLLKPSI